MDLHHQNRLRDATRLAHHPPVDSPTGSSRLSAASHRVALTSNTNNGIEHRAGNLQQQHHYQSRLYQSPYCKVRSPMPVSPKPAPPKSSVTSHRICSYGRIPTSYVPAIYTWDDGPSNIPGTTSYYKSRGFREKKKKVDAVQVSSTAADSVEGIVKADDYGSDQKDKAPAKPKSLVMIFSRTNVRRACEKRKVHLRQQRQNRRAKFWRSVDNEALFDWD